MKPTREHATNMRQTYMVTSTRDRQGHFRNERWARLLIDTLYHYRGSAYLLHEFVIMPDHIHVLITPLTNVEKAVQFIKGGFSYRAKKELSSNLEVWQKGFSDHRIRDARDYAELILYICQNPVGARLCEIAEDFPHSSAHSGFELDPAHQGLKPESLTTCCGAAEAAPFQSVDRGGTPEGVPLQNVFFQAEDGIRELTVTGVQTCALPISLNESEMHAFLSALEKLSGIARDAIMLSLLLGGQRSAQLVRLKPGDVDLAAREVTLYDGDRKSTRLNSSHSQISYAVFCLKKTT